MALGADRARFLEAISVSRETLAALDLYDQLIRQWQPHLNLVSGRTLDNLWSRHFLDSAQLFALAPSGARRWLDFGSGGGFPGLVLAILLRERPGARLELWESDRRKAAFLRTVARETRAPAEIHAERIEGRPPEAADVITARAVAPLDQLLTWAAPASGRNSVCLFPKGQHVEEELTQASKSWNIDVDLVPSITDPDARIVRISSFHRLASP